VSRDPFHPNDPINHLGKLAFTPGAPENSHAGTAKYPEQLRVYQVQDWWYESNKIKES
jgi:hypothetical protein